MVLLLLVCDVEIGDENGEGRWDFGAIEIREMGLNPLMTECKKVRKVRYEENPLSASL